MQAVNARFNMVLENVIREGRAENITEVAKVCNMALSNVSRIRAGEGNVTVDMLVRFLAFYEVNPAYVMPPWSRQMYLKGGREKLLKVKRIELEQAKKELKYLQELTK